MKTSKLSFRSVLVTGGTGTFGKAFVREILEQHPEVKRIVVFSRDEQKQFEMNREFPVSTYRQLRYFIGDVRDEQRLLHALDGIEAVVHAAALKHVPVAEYNPMEAIKTNVLGAENLINACLRSNVRRVVALSTDKAAAPINLYGATKLCADKLFVAANSMAGKKDLRFSVVRYGNVLGSRGSVVPFFLSEREKGILPITDRRMTRFNITIEQGVLLSLHALETMMGGEIFVPKIPSFRVTTLARAIAPRAKQVITGIRPGEKIHEEMITADDSLNTVEMKGLYIILPTVPEWDVQKWMKNHRVKKVKEGFSYNSGKNKQWLNEAAIRRMITRHLGVKL
ncbi:MAG: UDP-N-acetylglucosamine 4,6-dehydratase (inverting) [Bacteroidia bacterium]|nr:UDP-N-acetylglucosamine 4,6-dehydratase (inverting) [Bacteroidia bacterium]